MAPTIVPLDTTLGATVTDIDLASMDHATWKCVEDAFHEYAALIFPAQDLSADEQVAFSLRFGKIEHLRADPSVKSVSISNQKPDGSVIGPDDARFKTLRGNEGWHLDSTYMPLAAKAGVLSAKAVPSHGGETELADMRAAYDALDDAMKERIADLRAYHSLYASQAKIGYVVETGSGYGYHTKGAPLRPLVRVHPVTGRKSLCIGRHAYRIDGLDDDAAQGLLDELLEFACQPPRIHIQNWQPGDLIIWDNRCVMHRARPYDFNETRIMQATRIAGDPATDLAPTARDGRASGFKPATTNEIEAPAF
ncbi:MAG: (S)-phenoxypropionate/alpha-ketoglutarate-dioxygenase [Alphaproteobacteria bacterium MarineAlpha10_Bin3]|jgi:alpha-ketoglutarate-dependent taurine dioxygenase|nr:MAG: (S)-phenoxypropionate/alpha-ketoglutarate-dioxygenase [Alphaproteobacteria bacterium MarineAlpha10_Bin3]PPR73664.1 MAG: (S)-phenoxypropionate/alpha-ketoglutarate-dioxygenase [Alphaproteobacteria bacterium MarineAlpha4_Bin1]